MSFMESAEENLVSSMACEAGITTMYKAFIDVDNKLNLLPVTVNL